MSVEVCKMISKKQDKSKPLSFDTPYLSEYIPGIRRPSPLVSFCAASAPEGALDGDGRPAMFPSKT